MRDVCIYAGFVLVAAVFWFILAIDEETSADLELRVEITGVPDSVTLLTDPPASLRVNVRDKGSRLLRAMMMRNSSVRLDYKQFASDGYLRVSPKALLAHVHQIFGQGENVSLISADSIVIPYTSIPGKMVPVRVIYDVTPALGKVVSSMPRSTVRQVKVYAVRDIIDTISYVSTLPIVRRGVEDSFTVTVNLKPVKGVRFEPAKVQVTVPVEPLETRHISVPIRQVNVPAHQSLILFPEKVEVNYLAPMSSPRQQPAQFSVLADYRTIVNPADERMPIRIGSLPSGVTNATLSPDSVEFTIIHQLQPSGK